MSTAERLVTAARQILRQNGPEGLTTRAVCGMAGVTAPTLYHHFGTLDGLLDAALAQALREAGGRDAGTGDPVDLLLLDWLAFVAAAGAEPGLFGAALARAAQGTRLPALAAVRAGLAGRVADVGRTTLLSLPEDAACDAVWALAQGAALMMKETGAAPRSAWTLAALRQAVTAAILAPGRA